ncbi:hydantoinase/oxoprolinase family protein [Amycolatopsis jejuensis]|uniref:hydantoinase/oxoprolinase family protein n=1 Tax=Amycolatopsis jejuensis TaxID=330084 RepID=UPI000526DBE7|nr:hydantoinase/oxoprolinase family protein [Amycolatopsis jejuensis]
MSYVIGTDTGGTFTDTVVMDQDGRVTIGKRSSTPPEFVGGVLDSVADAAGKLGIDDRLLSDTDAFLYGTTIVVNAIATGQAANTGIITTQGFASTMFIARAASRTNGLGTESLRRFAERRKPTPLIPRNRRMVKELRERVDWKGQVLAPLDEDQVRATVAELVDAGAESLAVCLLWSFRNDAHEQRVREIAAEVAPGLPVTLSSELAPKMGEYERMTTSAYNAAMAPVASSHLDRLEDRLSAGGLAPDRVLVMQGNGGLDRSVHVTSRPVNLIGSGPAGGVLGAKVLAEAMGLSNVICTDVGGTTFDMGLLVNGKPVLTPTAVVHQHQLYLPIVDVVSIGAGGGSIARVDEVAGLLSVGPESAGAVPGPVCYGKGGEYPTVTDADLVLGFIDPDFFLGGSMRLDVAGAPRAIEEKVGKPLGLSVEEAAAAIVEIADNHMADTMRQQTVERGHDPRDFTAFLYGGGGPLHGTAYAPKLGITSMVVPGGELASVFSAWGIAGSDVHHTHELSSPMKAPFDTDALAEVFGTLEGRARERFDGDGVAEDARVVERYAELRYATQTNVVVVPVPGGRLDAAAIEGVVDAFEQQYERLYGEGSAFREAGVECINFRVQAYGVRRKPAIARHPLSTGTAQPSAKRSVYWYELKESRPTPVFTSAGLQPGTRIDGPAVVELTTTTVAVRPGQRLRVDEFANYVITPA